MKKIFHAAILTVVLFGAFAVPAFADGPWPIPPNSQMVHEIAAEHLGNLGRKTVL